METPTIENSDSIVCNKCPQGVDYCFATWAKNIIPYLIKPSHLLQIGIRSSAYSKSYWEETLGVQQYWMEDLASSGGVVPVLSEVLRQCHLSHDKD